MAVTFVTAIVVSVIAGLLPLARIAELANAGTLVAFVAVASCVMALRVLEPARVRVFRAPLVWLVGPLAVAGCVYLFYSLPTITQWRWLIWSAAGIAVYFLWGVHKSHLRNVPAR